MTAICELNKTLSAKNGIVNNPDIDLHRLITAVDCTGMLQPALAAEAAMIQALAQAELAGRLVLVGEEPLPFVMDRACNILEEGGNDKDQGMALDDFCKAAKPHGFTEQMARSALDYLCAKGFAYTTKDDFHFKVTGVVVTTAARVLDHPVSATSFALACASAHRTGVTVLQTCTATKIDQIGALSQKERTLIILKAYPVIDDNYFRRLALVDHIERTWYTDEHTAVALAHIMFVKSGAAVGEAAGLAAAL